MTPRLAAISDCGLAERLATGQQLGAENVSSQIAITGVKPGRLPQLTHGLQTKKRIALHAPAALLAQFAGQHVGDGIDIGRNIQAPPQHVVTRIHDDREFFWTNNPAQSIHEFSAASAASQDRNHALARSHSNVRSDVFSTA